MIKMRSVGGVSILSVPLLATVVALSMDRQGRWVAQYDLYSIVAALAIFLVPVVVFSFMAGLVDRIISPVFAPVTVAIAITVGWMIVFSDPFIFDITIGKILIGVPPCRENANVAAMIVAAGMASGTVMGLVGLVAVGLELMVSWILSQDVVDIDAKLESLRVIIILWLMASLAQQFTDLVNREGALAACDATGLFK